MQATKEKKKAKIKPKTQEQNKPPITPMNNSKQGRGYARVH